MLDSLHIKNFRCFEDLTIQSLGHVNLIVGKNSVGKTTLLEALHILGSGGLMGTIEQILINRGLPFIDSSLVFNSAISSAFYIGNTQQTFGIEITIDDDEFKLKSIDNFIEKNQ
jgi:AAA15 family ATPase/GTPase